MVRAEELNTSRTNTGAVVDTFPLPGCDIYEDVFALCTALSKSNGMYGDLMGLLQTTGLLQNAGPRMCELSFRARGSQDIRAYNLGPDVLTIPVMRIWLWFD